MARTGCSAQWTQVIRNPLTPLWHTKSPLLAYPLIGNAPVGDVHTLAVQAAHMRRTRSGEITDTCMCKQMECGMYVGKVCQDHGFSPSRCTAGSDLRLQAHLSCIICGPPCKVTPFTVGISGCASLNSPAQVTATPSAFAERSQQSRTSTSPCTMKQASQISMLRHFDADSRDMVQSQFHTLSDGDARALLDAAPHPHATNVLWVFRV
jgi:hypothetical protein